MRCQRPRGHESGGWERLRCRRTRKLDDQIFLARSPPRPRRLLIVRVRTESPSLWGLRGLDGDARPSQRPADGFGKIPAAMSPNPMKPTATEIQHHVLAMRLAWDAPSQSPTASRRLTRTP